MMREEYTNNNPLTNGFRIRKLTEREVFRLMDVSEEDIDKIQKAGINIKRFGLQQQNLIGNESPAARGVEDVEWSALAGTVKRQYVRV